MSSPSPYNHHINLPTEDGVQASSGAAFNNSSTSPTHSPTNSTAGPNNLFNIHNPQSSSATELSFSYPLYTSVQPDRRPLLSQLNTQVHHSNFPTLNGLDPDTFSASVTQASAVPSSAYPDLTSAVSNNTTMWSTTELRAPQPLPTLSNLNATNHQVHDYDEGSIFIEPCEDEVHQGQNFHHPQHGTSPLHSFSPLPFNPPHSPSYDGSPYAASNNSLSPIALTHPNSSSPFIGAHHLPGTPNSASLPELASHHHQQHFDDGMTRSRSNSGAGVGDNSYNSHQVHSPSVSPYTNPQPCTPLSASFHSPSPLIQGPQLLHGSGMGIGVGSVGMGGMPMGGYHVNVVNQDSPSPASNALHLTGAPGGFIPQICEQPQPSPILPGLQHLSINPNAMSPLNSPVPSPSPTTLSPPSPLLQRNNNNAVQTLPVELGPFVPQKMYKPHTLSDQRRYVQGVSLEPAITFELQNPPQTGIPLKDALTSRFLRLTGRDDLMFENRGPSVSIRLQWEGYQPWSRQIPTRDFRSPPGPITRSKLAKNVAKCVSRFIEDHKGCKMEPHADLRWRVGPQALTTDDLVLVSLHHVSMGSWQANLRLARRLL